MAGQILRAKSARSLERCSTCLNRNSEYFTGSVFVRVNADCA